MKLRIAYSKWASCLIVNRLGHCDLNHGPLANLFHHLAHDPTLKAKAILVKADQVADALGLDDEVIDELVVGLGLELPHPV